MNEDREAARLRRRALVTGVVALAISVACALYDSTAFYRAWLASFVFWIGIPLGCLVILQMHYLSGGAWGIVIRRVAESAASTLPVLLVLFVPIAIGMRWLFVWTHPDVVAATHELQEKAIYLNVPFFLVRAALYFVAWIALARVLVRWSQRRDEAPNFDPRRFRLLSGPGLVVYGLTITFASVDWGMSLDPLWYSSIYPMIFSMGQVLSAFAFAIIAAVCLREREPFGRLVNPSNLIDLGNLMLTFVVLWAYVAFSQFMLIWAGDIRQEVAWYLPRLGPGWLAVAIAVIGLHFGLPFALLLMRPLKRNPRTLAAIAGFILVVRLMTDFWTIVPGFAGAEGFHWVYLTTPVALGGLWLAAFLWRLSGVPLVPGNEPLVEHAMTVHGH